MKSIPCRFWPNPNTCIYGFLDIEDEMLDPSGLVFNHNVTFRAAALRKDEPMLDVRIYPATEED